jgi:hypothetical protein
LIIIMPSRWYRASNHLLVPSSHIESSSLSISSFRLDHVALSPRSFNGIILELRLLLPHFEDAKTTASGDDEIRDDSTRRGREAEGGGPRRERVVAGGGEGKEHGMRNARWWDEGVEEGVGSHCVAGEVGVGREPCRTICCEGKDLQRPACICFSCHIAKGRRLRVMTCI